MVPVCGISREDGGALLADEDDNYDKGMFTLSKYSIV